MGQLHKNTVDWTVMLLKGMLRHIILYMYFRAHCTFQACKEIVSIGVCTNSSKLICSRKAKIKACQLRHAYTTKIKML